MFNNIIEIKNAKCIAYKLRVKNRISSYEKIEYQEDSLLIELSEEYTNLFESFESDEEIAFCLYEMFLKDARIEILSADVSIKFMNFEKRLDFSNAKLFYENTVRFLKNEISKNMYINNAKKLNLHESAKAVSKKFLQSQNSNYLN